MNYQDIIAVDKLSMAYFDLDSVEIKRDDYAILVHRSGWRFGIFDRDAIQKIINDKEKLKIIDEREGKKNGQS